MYTDTIEHLEFKIKEIKINNVRIFKLPKFFKIYRYSYIGFFK